MDKNTELISVVVPIYGVEKYLKRCLDSILRQSYTNLEIILVDDGSPDACGKICDEYQLKDQRISTVHQDNKGLSGARNTGLEHSSGKFIIFIDSDDFIEDKMIEILYQNIKETDSDVSICGYYQVKENEIDQIHKDSSPHVVRTLSRKECLEQLLYHKSGIDIVTWNKLYKTRLFDNVRFPQGKIYEDFATIPFAIHKASRVCVTTEKLYYYIQREGSINASQKMNNKIFDLIENVSVLEDFISKEYPDSLPLIIPGILFFKSIAVNEFIKHGVDTEQSEYINSCSEMAKHNRKMISNCTYLYREQKFKLLLLCNLNVYKLAIRIKNIRR